MSLDLRFAMVFEKIIKCLNINLAYLCPAIIS